MEPMEASPEKPEVLLVAAGVTSITSKNCQSGVRNPRAKKAGIDLIDGQLS